MNKRVSSKETLAKLMATENIFVEHANVPTAGFDLINRKLLLPNWKNISDDVYTLLISHEVGHALFTPTDEWQKSIIDVKDSSFKQVVNIVEDVRIEKLIQSKYPGSVRSFKSGYDELEKSNLFGTKDREIESYGLLDRLNLHFKLGHFGYAKVPFSDKELPWVNRVSSCKTFSDVLKVATELKQFVEENPESQSKNQNDGGESETEISEIQCDSESTSESTNTQQTQQSLSMGSSDQNAESDKQQDQKDLSDNQSNDELDTKDSKNDAESIKPSKVYSETQTHFDSALKNLIDKTILDTKYANLPDINLDKIIVPYKLVHKQISEYYSTHFSSVYKDSQVTVEQFKSGSKNVVNQLANIFEMKKKAKLDVRSLTSRTGELNMNRVYSYRYNDDVFKKVTVTPQGKSHGLVMFIDMSSSMCDNIAGTFEQLLNLVLFCRRVNIPFDVYGFTDTYAARTGLQKHSSKGGELTFDDSFCLRHYFSSKMTGVEFNVALQNIICIMRHYSGLLYAGLPPQEVLNTTPLVPTIMAATKILQDFRRDHGLDIVNTIFLTDGDDTHGLVYNDGLASDKAFHNGRSYYLSRSVYQKYFVRDVKTKKTWEINNPTSDMLNILREVAGVKVIGFHIIRKRELGYTLTRHVQNQNEIDKHTEMFKQHKFAELSNVDGYDAYYMIPSGNGLSVSDDEFESSIDTTIDWDNEKQAKKAMKTVQKSFSNFMKQRVSSRILLNRFIEHIS